MDNVGGERELKTEIGTIKIADEVVAIVAGLAASEVEGVAGMSGGITGGIAELLGRKNMSKGVKVEVGEKEAAIDVFVVMHYGIRIPEVALEIQQRVHDAVEKMTGLRVVEINVHVQGIDFPQVESVDDEKHPRVR